MNGSAAIHDFEIALAGQNAVEDVEAVLPDGRFGAAEETGREWNAALIPGMGAGEALGQALDGLAPKKHAGASLLLQAWRAKVPVTVSHRDRNRHAAHTHPTANPEALGRATHHDFRLFCSLVAGLHDGGVYINAGSAVVMPEVFLKAISCVREPWGMKCAISPPSIWISCSITALVSMWWNVRMRNPADTDTR